MPTWEFLTVPEELLGVAAATADYFSDLGWTVVPETHELGYPYAPTLRCKRHSTVYFVEVGQRPQMDRMEDWVAYAKSVDSDTRIILALPEDAILGVRAQMQLKELGVGLLLVSTRGVSEAMPAKDLALQVALPELRKESKPLRRLLGPIYEQFDRNQWRDGFEAACLALETEARAYLWKALASGRTIVLTEKGNKKNLTKAKVDKMTMGALAVDFARIQQPNHTDSMIGQALQLINPDRILVAHKRLSPRAERKLRKNVGPAMWRILHALRELDKV